MTNPVSASKKPRKQHTPEFRSEALKLAERIGVAAAAHEPSLYESQLFDWRSKLKNAHSSSEREQEMSVEIVRLKRQLAEKAILQKAATYCAKRLKQCPENVIVHTDRGGQFCLSRSMATCERVIAILLP